MAGEIAPLEYRVSDFSRLQAGSVPLSVPVFRNVMQVFSGPPKAKAPVNVSIKQGSIDIVRTDEEPIQISRRERFSEKQGTYMARIVLAEPVKRLQFYQTELSSLWRVNLHPEIIQDPEGLELFATLVGRYALERQRRPKTN